MRVTWRQLSSVKRSLLLSSACCTNHICQVNAELVAVNDKNYDYLAQTISSNSGNDNWIGTGQIGGKQYKRQGTKCPIIRGSGSAMGSKVSTLDCSVAAPFVCGYNPNPMPQYPAYGMPRPGMGAPGGMGGYPMMPPQGTFVNLAWFLNCILMKHTQLEMAQSVSYILIFMP